MVSCLDGEEPRVYYTDFVTTHTNPDKTLYFEQVLRNDLGSNMLYPNPSIAGDATDGMRVILQYYVNKVHPDNSKEVEVKGRKYLLVHAGIADFDPDTPMDDYMPEDLIYEPADLERIYFDDVTLVVGHTPSYTVEGADKGKVFYGEGVILMDCGAAFGETLGCLCLETGKEYYVS